MYVTILVYAYRQWARKVYRQVEKNYREKYQFSRYRTLHSDRCMSILWFDGNLEGTSTVHFVESLLEISELVYIRNL